MHAHQNSCICHGAPKTQQAVTKAQMPNNQLPTMPAVACARAHFVQCPYHGREKAPVHDTPSAMPAPRDRAIDICQADCQHLTAQQPHQPLPINCETMPAPVKLLGKQHARHTIPAQARTASICTTTGPHFKHMQCCCRFSIQALALTATLQKTEQQGRSRQDSNPAIMSSTQLTGGPIAPVTHALLKHKVGAKEPPLL